MKNKVAIAIFYVASFFSVSEGSRHLNEIEFDAQKNMQSFNDLSRSISISDISESIVSNDAQELKKALRDVMDLNQMVNAQVHASMQLWNMYLDSVKVPSMETYLLGQVMNSLITSIRALTLRSSVDQSMILSLVKKHFNDESDSRSDFGQTMDSRDARFENNWRSLRQE
jgi:hypothetical protein